MSEAPHPERRPRLNPFAFPSDTTFRFGLLIAAVLGANLYVWQWIAITSRTDDAEHIAATRACLTLLGTDAFTPCTNALYRYQVGWMLGGTAGLLVVAVALMLAAPLWITRRRKLRRLEHADAPAVVDRVAELAREQELDPPRIFWNPLDASSGGLAFGHPGRYSVAIGGGLVVKHATDRPAFDAVIRHELAHIRNRDVGITYFTLAVWYAFLLVAVLPFFLTLIGQGDVFVDASWRIAALAALVYLTRNAVLRSREVYADVRASVPDGRDGALRRVLESLPAQSDHLVARLRAVHPLPKQRIEALEDTRPLFPLGAVAAFAAGLAATIAFDSVAQLLSTYIDDGFDLRFLAGLVLVPLAAGVVGVAIWRQAFAAHAEGKAPDAPWVDALAFAAGFLLGPELALQQIAVVDQTFFRDSLDGTGLPYTLAFVGVLLLVVAWIRASASWWVRALGGRRPTLAMAAGVLVAGIALTTLISVVYAMHSLRDALAVSRLGSAIQHAAVDASVWTVPKPVWQFVMDAELLVIVYKPYFVPVLVALILFPYAAILVRRRPTDAPWAFLDPGGELRTPPLPRLHPLQPLVIGAAAGLVLLALAAIVRLGMHNGVSAETRATDAALLSFYVSMVALAILVQLIAGAAGAVRGGLIGALGAAFVAGCFGWLAIVGGPFAGGCVDSLSLNPGPCAWTVEAGFSWNVFKQVIAQGAIAGLAGGLLVVATQAVLRRRRAEEPQPAGVALTE
jgi:Zn-dependent protease with chaperone function